MKFYILSDLHTEFGREMDDNIVRSEIVEQCDVVVLAGDIGVGRETFRYINYVLAGCGKPVVFVYGNHEFYNRDISTVKAEALELDMSLDFHILDDNYVDIDGVRIHGATLWTDYNISGNQPLAMIDAAAMMNDCRLIRDHGERINPQYLLDAHNKSVEILSENIDVGMKNVVITHHAPCGDSIHPRYRNARDSHMNASFASDLTHLFGDHVPLWVHGHMHDSFDYVKYGTRVVCNPRGYFPSQLNPGFDREKLVEV